MSFQVFRRRLLPLAVTILGFAGALGAQVERGTIAGTVRDASGAIVPNVNVTVKNVNTGVEFKTASNEAGEYVAPNLIPGEYSVTASAQGFSTLVRTGIVLHVNDRIAVELTLTVGTVTEQVSVTAAAPLLQSETSSVVTLISRRDISELPLNGRTVFQLAPLTAGVNNARNTTNANNVDIPDNARAKQGLSVNGQRESANTYILDGAYNNQINQGLIAILPPLEAVQEFTLETSNFLPEIGRGGGVMNVTLKSGTNNFHGQVFEFHRNAALDARNFFDRQTRRSPRRLPNFVKNQFGGTFGGPIRKDKTFFFGDYQGLREVKGQTFQTVVPGPAVRGGNFGGTTQPIFDPATACGFGTNPACVDVTGDGAPDLTRQPFAGNTIDPARFNPVSLKILDLVPLPNDPAGEILGLGGGLFFSGQGRRHNEDSFDIKIDHRISDRDSFTGRFSYGNSHTVLPGAWSEDPQFGPSVGGALGSGGAGFLTGIVDNPARSLALQEIHNFSPRVVNEFRAAYVRAGSDAVHLGFGNKYGDQLGIPNVNVTDNNSGFPTMFLGGGTTPIGDSPFFPLIEFENVFQYLDNVTFIRGKHTFKAGADFKKVGRNFTQILGFPAGIFGFGGGFTNDPLNTTGTGNGFADFLLGIPANGSLIRNAGMAGLRSTEFAAYWQDTWKVTQKLTLNYGIRYELWTPQTEVHDRGTNFDLGTGKLLLPGGEGASDPGYMNRALVRTDKNNFAPRFGFAYKFTENNVLRASYGVFYVAESQAGFQFTQNPPFVGGVSYFNVASGQQVINRTLDQGLPVTDPFISIDQFSGSINAYNPDYTRGYTQQWSMGIQRQLSPTFLLDVTYVGNSSQHLGDLHNPNAPFPGTGSPVARTPYFTLTGGKNFGLTFIEQRGKGNYNALQTTLTKRFSKGLSFLTNYTWSHGIENTSHWFGGTFHQDERNLNADRANSGNDVRHRWVASWLYELPFGRGKAYGGNASGVANAFVGGWQIGGLTVIQSGSPYTVTGGGGRPNRTCDGRLSNRTVEKWFDDTCFPLPAQVPDLVRGGFFTPFGNAGSNILPGPGLLNFDLSAFKSVYVGEETRFEFRAEFFNAFNHPQFLNPSSGVPSPGVAGRIFNARESRQIQMVLKFIF